VERCTHVGTLLSGREGFKLKERQVDAISAVARGDDLLGVLPTGYGKSYCFQLPALVLPGTTIIVSPLVSLMTDQALELNRVRPSSCSAVVTAASPITNADRPGRC
jgi:superfamily II DNA helicase RecQ